MVFYVGRHRAPQKHSPVRRSGTLGAAAFAAAGIALPPTATAAEAAPASTAARTVGAATAATAAQTATLASARANFRGTVRMGDRGAIVPTIQRKVGASADGVFGPRTRAKVMSYQRRHGLVADGVVGPKTGTRMGLSAAAKPAKKSSRTTTRTTGSASGIVRTARSLTGSRYRWGGTTPAGFDCSGFTSYVFRKNGKSIPRTADAQRRAARKVSKPVPGDLVFFGAPSYHVGIYTGNGKMVDAGNSRGRVSERKIWTSRVSYGRF